MPDVTDDKTPCCSLFEISTQHDNAGAIFSFNSGLFLFCCCVLQFFFLAQPVLYTRPCRKYHPTVLCPAAISLSSVLLCFNVFPVVCLNLGHVILWISCIGNRVRWMKMRFLVICAIWKKIKLEVLCISCKADGFRRKKIEKQK